MAATPNLHTALVGALIFGMGWVSTPTLLASEGARAPVSASPAAGDAIETVSPALFELIDKYADFYRKQAESSQAMAKEHREFLERLYVIFGGMLSAAVMIFGGVVMFFDFRSRKNIQQEVAARLSGEALMHRRKYACPIRSHPS